MPSVNDLGGYTRAEIDWKDGELRGLITNKEAEANAKILRECERTDRLEKHIHGNGQPGLERRLMDYVTVELERVKRHQNANIEQGDSDVMNELKHESKERERQHAENKEQRAIDKEEHRAGIEAITAEVRDMGKKVNRLTTWGLGVGIAFFLLKGAEDLGIIKVQGAEPVKNAIRGYLE